MFEFVQKSFRKCVTVLLWLFPVLGGISGAILLAGTFGVFWSVVGSVLGLILGLAIGIFVGLLMSILFGGLIATFLTMADNIEKLAKVQEKQ